MRVTTFLRSNRRKPRRTMSWQKPGESLGSAQTYRNRTAWKCSLETSYTLNYVNPQWPFGECTAQGNNTNEPKRCKRSRASYLSSSQLPGEAESCSAFSREHPRTRTASQSWNASLATTLTMQMQKSQLLQAKPEAVAACNLLNVLFNTLLF